MLGFAFGSPQPTVLLPTCQVNRNLLPSRLFLQSGQQRFSFNQSHTDGFEPFGFPFQAGRLMVRFTNVALGDQLNSKFHIPSKRKQPIAVALRVLRQAGID
ncbi:MAG: hypothetical protein M0Z81_09170 [Deltaproteobacteria bacterium]|nr:hypothetical protein [Deltaproteobacteria bacterium]